MTTKDEALALALEALELSSITVDNFTVQAKCQDAITAIKQAQQAQEPVIDYTVLHQFAEQQGISYNKLCTTVQMCLTHPAPKQAEPEGYKLVPVEPTKEMFYAIQNDCDILTQRAKRVWATMLAAAPTPPEAS